MLMSWLSTHFLPSFQVGWLANNVKMAMDASIA